MCGQANRWLSLRLELMGESVVFLTAVMASVLLQANAGLAGLAITSSLNMCGFLNWMVRSVSEMEVRPFSFAVCICMPQSSAGSSSQVLWVFCVILRCHRASEGLAITSSLNMCGFLDWMVRSVSEMEVRCWL